MFTHLRDSISNRGKEITHETMSPDEWMNACMNGFILNKRPSKQMYFPSNQEGIYQINMKTYMNNMISRNNQTCFLCILFFLWETFLTACSQNRSMNFWPSYQGLWETTCVCDVQREGPLWQHLLQVCDGTFVEGVLVMDAFFFPHWFSQGLRILCPYNSGPQTLHPVPQYNLNSAGK